MSNKSFESYAYIYDAFYIDKNYKKECENLFGIAKSLTKKLDYGIEIGAGSGTFTKELAKYLQHVKAFELSPVMAEICANNLSKFQNITVNQGDLKQTLNSSIEINSIDLVIANFHVFTYFSEKEISQFVDASVKFLRVGGIVSFDFWDLQAVCAAPPVQVVKVAHIEGKEITRKTIPQASNDFREIKVNFEFYESSNLLFTETHVMHPKSLEEVKGFFAANFEFCGSYDITSGKEYSQKNYGNLVYFRKIKD
jgi:precorrin-6B methylase 2